MRTSSTRVEAARARNVSVTSRALVVELHDGRTVSVPLEWYPRLASGTPKERRQWRLIAAGIGIHWPALDEDISVEGLLQGLPSGESAASLKRWQTERHRPANRRLQPTKARRQVAKKPRTTVRLRG